MERALEIAARYSESLDNLEKATQRRVAKALESSYRKLERDLLASYRKHGGNLDLLARQRTLLIMDEIRSQLELIDPVRAKRITTAYESMLTQATREGYDAAGDLNQAMSSEKLKPFSAVPTDAIAAQASEGLARLKNHVAAFATKASAVVEQGLVQGWGPRKVARALRSELGVTASKAETIARTEVMSAYNSAAKTRYKKGGIEYGQWMATGSDRLCPVCADRNMRVYKLEDIVIPAHPRCRCMVVPYSPNWDADTEFTERYREQTIADLRATGVEPSGAVSPFEKAAGMTTAPQPVNLGGGAQLGSRAKTGASAATGQGVTREDIVQRRADLVAVANGRTKSLEPYRRKVLDEMVEEEIRRLPKLPKPRKESTLENFRRVFRQQIPNERALEVVARTKKAAQDARLASGAIKSRRTIPEWEAYQILRRVQNPGSPVSFSSYVDRGLRRFPLSDKDFDNLAKLSKVSIEHDALMDRLTALRSQRTKTARASELTEINKRITELRAQREALTNSLNAKMVQFRNQLRSQMSQETAMLLVADRVNITDKVWQGTADTLVEIVQMTNGRGLNTLNKVSYESGRAFADPRGPLNIGYPIPDPGGAPGKFVSRSDLFHEYGHHVEYSLDMADSNRAAVINRATAASRSLTEVNRAYVDEYYFPDRWVDPYTGKDYAPGAKDPRAVRDVYTEVTSMGLEHFHSSQAMVHLITKDPEHFYQVLGAISDD
jgi:SPP1 gp7 family putative phage head morphogenesis protein